MEYEIGKIYKTINGDAMKIMAYSERHYMVRYPGCIPFVVYEDKLKNMIANSVKGHSINSK